MFHTPASRTYGLITIAIVVILVGIGAFLLIGGTDSARRSAEARNSVRASGVSALLEAIRKNIATNHDTFTCGTGVYALPSFPAVMKSSYNGIDIAFCIAPTYIPTLPFDPSIVNAHYSSNTDYDTGYTVSFSSTDDLVTVCAPAALNERAISPTPPAICATR
ncbi:hypothetical protein HY090_02690 [Candidatus Kaiserbacteria bacterium]|nr:hypothetical protein [Candidatus Kaiserbacteria bacterium]